MPSPKDPIKYKEWKRKISLANVGRPVSDKIRNNLIEMNKNYGKPWNNEQKSRHKEIKGKHFKGKKPWNWKGGLTQEEKAGRPKPEICEICGGGGIICFDHSHTTGKFRGWICTNCNFALGHARDKVEILKKLIDYLEQNAFL